VSLLFELQHRFTVDEVLAMVEHGILHDDDHVQLLEGILIDRTPQGHPHARTTTLVGEALYAHFRAEHPLLVHCPIQLGTTSLPEPDVAVLRQPIRALPGHPKGHDCLLVVEVAVTSHALDHHKARLYAAGGVPVYWLVDVPGRRVLVHQGPRASGFQQLTTYEAGDDVPLPDDRGTVRVDDLF
jgi:Uma2 family endonuclease